jgi:hypothetical protein
MGGAVGAAVFGAVLSNRFAHAFQAALPPPIAGRIPQEMLAQFANPQALMNPETAARMREATPQALQMMAPILGAVRQALARSIAEVFLVGAVLTALGTLFALRLVDLPLRTTNRSARVPASGQPPAAPLAPLDL